MRFFIFLLCFLSFFSQLSYAHSGIEHRKDFFRVFNGYGDLRFSTLSYSVTKGIDDGLPGLFRDKMKGPIPGNHRILGHGWSFNDSIPERVLGELENMYPGRKREIIDIWRNYVNNLSEEAVKLTGLPKPQAKALVGILHDIHLLGDLEPGNTRIDLVLQPKEITNNIIKNAETLFKNNPQFSQEIRERLLKVLLTNQGKDPQIVAELLSDEMGRLKWGDKLNHSWHNRLTTHFDQRRAGVALEMQNRRIAQRLAKNSGSTIQPSLKRLTVGDFGKRRGRGKICPAVITADGRIAAFISRAGGMGMLLISPELGISCYQYVTGSIRKGEFEKRIKEAAIKGLAVGSATAVAIVLGITPGGWVVEGIVFATYEIADIAIKLTETKHISAKDLKAFEVEIESILEAPLDSVLDMPEDSVLAPNIDSPLQLEHDSVLAP